MKLAVKLFAAIPLWVVLNACGDGSNLGGGDEDGGNPSYKILSFDVNGTSVDNAAGAAPISPTVNSGRFSMRWEVQDVTGDHVVNAVVSLDNSRSNGDVSFYTEICDLADPEDSSDTDAACRRSNPFTKSCTFNNSNEIFCDGQASDAGDLTTFLAGGVPQEAFIIFQACATSGSPCRSAAHLVEFQ